MSAQPRVIHITRPFSEALQQTPHEGSEPWILKSDYDELYEKYLAEHAIQILNTAHVEELQTKLTEAERLLGVALEAMKYHTEQTRPIQRTIDAIKELGAMK